MTAHDRYVGPFSYYIYPRRINRPAQLDRAHKNAMVHGAKPQSYFKTPEFLKNKIK
jgi:hypothetical protein